MNSKHSSTATDARELELVAINTFKRNRFSSHSTNGIEYMTNLTYYIHEGPKVVQFQLSGSLTGMDASKLDQAWRTASSTIAAKALTVDVTFLLTADEKGRDLLFRWHRAGAHFIANSPAPRSLIELVTGAPYIIAGASVTPTFDPCFILSALRVVAFLLKPLLLLRVPCVSLVVFFFVLVCQGQQVSPEDPTQSGPPASNAKKATEHEDKRLLGIIPNYRTSPSLENYKPLTAREKLKVASEDAFDPGTIALAALFGAQSQLTDGNRAFGQGVRGFGRYFGAAYGDLVIGDYMTESVFPTLLHQDPRYFRRGTGGGWSRLGYAMGQTFWTHRDSGGSQFNYSEFVGNSTAVAISQSYYANNRTAADATAKLGMQLGVDMTANILKEFWPEIRRKLRARPRAIRGPAAGIETKLNN